MTTPTTDTQHLAAAWAWTLRLRDETVTEADLSEWLTWYEANESHKEAFEAAQALWHETPKILEGPGALRLDQLLSESGLEVQPPPQPQRRTLLRWSLGITAAAAAVLTAVIISVNLPSKVTQPTKVATTVQVPPVRHDLLPDGSRVELAPKSTLDVRFTDSERAIDFKGGEAFFAVAQNRDRPFIVNVGGLKVRALGTAFNIRQAGDRVVVSVTEGKVQVSKGAGETAKLIVLAAGRRVTYNAGSAKPVLAQADTAQTLAWRQGRLEYLNEPLSSVIADLNRYSSERVVIDDPAVGNLRFSGTVFTDATDVWLQALPRVFPLRLEHNEQSGRTVIQAAE